MIYVVEDDPGIRELECYALRQAGFEARGFEEGQSFLEAVRVQLPQLVLLDVMLPGEDGNRLLARLKQDSRTRGLPVIMVTARGEEIGQGTGSGWRRGRLYRQTFRRDGAAQPRAGLCCAVPRMNSHRLSLLLAICAWTWHATGFLRTDAT